ncbi:NifB/NifX family molybdenum-iron cluster-binding protein [Phormidium sp. LEGE 05292]|nr:NifB/NifX family molybdenum-iron cluster-binding protein [Phormidium sp. LEGE 05292]
MKIALSSQNQKSITGHAGHCQKFWVYEINGTEIIDKELVELSPKQCFHNSSPDESHALDEVQVLICGGMGKKLLRRLESKGIEAIVTKETDLDNAIAAYLNGSLVREDAECGEHEHEHEHSHQHQHRHQHGQECQINS